VRVVFFSMFFWRVRNTLTYAGAGLVDISPSMRLCTCVVSLPPPLPLRHVAGYAPFMLAYVRGTPGFMAPEVCEGVHITVDLCGNPAFGGMDLELGNSGAHIHGACLPCVAFTARKRS
jgi:hypothetical protein